MGVCYNLCSSVSNQVTCVCLLLVQVAKVYIRCTRFILVVHLNKGHVCCEN